MKITISEQVARGNFAGDSSSEQQKYAEKYVEIMEENLTEYINKNYPNAKIKFELEIENVSGCARGISVDVDTEDFCDTPITDDVLSHAEYIRDKNSEEIYNN